MNDEGLRTEAPSGLVTAAAWLLFCAVLSICGTAGQPSPDLWWQLAGGRLLVEGGVFPWTDSFSFTAGDRVWLNHEWLAEWAMYLVYRAGGLAALHAARLVLLFLVFWSVSRVGRLLGAGEASLAAAAALAVLNAQWRFFFDVRPYLFTYLGVALSFWFAVAWLRTERRTWLVLLPVTYVAWANLHSGVIAGLALLVAVTVGACRSRPRAAAWLFGATLAAAGASLLNPYGSHILTFPFEFLAGRTAWSAGLNEWARPDLLGEQWTFVVYLTFVAVCSALEWRRVEPSVLLVVLGFGALSTTAWRHLTVFAIVSVPVVAVAFQGSWERVCARRRPSRRMVTALAACALVVGAGGSAFRLWRTDLASLSMERALFPVDAVDFLRANALPQRVYNAYGWGGYLMWTVGDRYKVFMDGRANTLFPQQAYKDFLRIGAGVPDWETLLAQYDVRVVMLNRWETARMGDHSLARVIGSSPHWGRIYHDDIADIWVHRDDSTRELWARAASHALYLPAAARLAEAREDVEAGRNKEAEAALRSLVAAGEQEARARALLAIVLVRSGRTAEAEACLRRAIAVDPALPELHYNLGALLAARGDRAAAIDALEEELRINPGFEPARHQLDQMRAPR